MVPVAACPPAAPSQGPSARHEPTAHGSAAPRLHSPTAPQPAQRQRRSSGLSTPENCGRCVILKLAFTTCISQILGMIQPALGWIARREPTAGAAGRTAARRVHAAATASCFPYATSKYKKTKELLITGVHPAPFPEAFNSLNRKWVLSSWKINHYPLPVVIYNTLYAFNLLRCSHL